MTSLEPDPAKAFNRTKLRRILSYAAIFVAGLALADVRFRLPVEVIFVSMVVAIATQDVVSELAIRANGGFAEGGNFAVHWAWITPLVLVVGLLILLAIP